MMYNGCVPEGHTIHRLARDHARALVGRVVRVASPQGRHSMQAEQLDQHVLECVEAHGKHLFYRWRGAPILHVHLGLFGSFRQSPVPPSPNTQLRLHAAAATFDLIGATTCELIDDERYGRLVGRLGPDLLAETADPEPVWQQLQRRATPIASALVDQRILSGVGNVYRLEALFVCGIHPERPARSLTRAEFDRLWQTLRVMLRQGVEEQRIVTVHPAERTNGAQGEVPLEDAFYVYKQHHCRRCGSAIRAWRLGTRPVYACERCQPPAARPRPTLERRAAAG
jgi:endonuclease VIII